MKQWVRSSVLSRWMHFVYRLTAVFIFFLQAETAFAGSPSLSDSFTGPGFQASPPWYKSFLDHPGNQPGIILLQLILIMLSARFFAYLAHKIQQPGVVGEMVAGIVLGPSLLGWLFPSLMHFLFPESSLPILQAFSQLGLILFMFVIGMELDPGLVQNRLKSALFISQTGIFVPFLLGVGLSVYLYDQYVPPGVDFLSFSLFLGISMSITAFPVLARIIQEKGITGTPFGAMVLTCAAAGDIAAWGLLAIIVAIVQAGGIIGAFFTFGFSFLFLFIMIYWIRPVLARASAIYITHDSFTRSVVAYMIVVVFVSALYTEISGIHALFGAFLAGAIMPGDRTFKSRLILRFEDLSLSTLLPIFFALTGLRTTFGSIVGTGSPEVLILVIGAAIIGKFAGSYVPARLMGMNQYESVTIGVLMNTRGLMELIVLNIGYDLGIITSEIFTLLVLMTVFTTFMTGPMLTLTDRFFGVKKSIAPSGDESATGTPVFGLRLLMPFGPSRSGVRLLQLASWISGGDDGAASRDHDRVRITALHLSPSSYRTHPDVQQKRKIFQPVLRFASRQGLDVQTLYLQTPDVARTICQVAREQGDDYIILGSARPLFGRSVTGGIVGRILKEAKSSVIVYVDRGLRHPKEIGDGGRQDLPLLDIGDRLCRAGGFAGMILYTNDSLPVGALAGRRVKEKKRELPCTAETNRERSMLLLISLEEYEKRLAREAQLFSEECSMLVVKQSSGYP